MSASPRPRLAPSHHSARLARRRTSQIRRNLRVLITKGLVQKFTDEHGVERYRTFVSKVKDANA